MKIGVTTFLNDNYGTALQAFALQKKLNALGAQSYILAAKPVRMPLAKRITARFK